MFAKMSVSARIIFIWESYKSLVIFFTLEFLGEYNLKFLYFVLHIFFFVRDLYNLLSDMCITSYLEWFMLLRLQFSSRTRYFVVSIYPRGLTGLFWLILSDSVRSILSDKSQPVKVSLDPPTKQHFHIW
jgi:hypothetical protein